jgi:superfamily I DNA/RNA helicase
MSIINVGAHIQPKEKMLYSSYQTDIFKEVEHGLGNVIVEAVAGSGKTTTIVHALDMIPIRCRSIFLAFNKSIATELATKVPTHVQARTLHSLGYEILRNNHKYCKSNSKFVMNQLKFEVLSVKTQPAHSDWAWENGKDMCTIMSRMKGIGETNPDLKMFEELAYMLDLDMEWNNFSRSLVMPLWEKITSYTGEKGFCTIDFDDMIYLPATRDMEFPQFDYVILDEAQDLNKMQREFVGKLLSPNGRLIAVGDTKQSIYGFRGADHNSMRRIKQEFGCTELPLSISYRCSKAVVAHAKKFVPHIEHHKNAPQGLVAEIDISDLRFAIRAGDHILCRTNAPLVKQALRLGMQGNNVCVLGKDIVPGIMKLAKNIDNNYDGIHKNAIWQYYELSICALKEGQEWKMYGIKDKCEILGYVVENDTLSEKEVKMVLDEIFTDTPPISAHITMSTIHKSKGLEAKRIFILRPDLLPHPMCKGGNERIQEDNLHYVAITRAKEELWYVTEPE